MYTEDQSKAAAQALAANLLEKLADNDSMTVTAVNPALVGTYPRPRAALQVETRNAPTLNCGDILKVEHCKVSIFA